MHLVPVLRHHQSAFGVEPTEAGDLGQPLGRLVNRRGGPIAELPNVGTEHVGDVECILRASLTTAFITARETLPALIERGGGSIVIVSSIAGLAAGPSLAGYVSAKHGVIGLTRSLARDYGPRGVRVNAVCPGWVRTPVGDEQMDILAARDGITREEAYALTAAHVPLRRPAEPREIASIIAFLASDDSSFVTGSVLVVDGGASAVDVPTLAFEEP